MSEETPQSISPDPTPEPSTSGQERRQYRRRSRGRIRRWYSIIRRRFQRRVLLILGFSLMVVLFSTVLLTISVSSTEIISSWQRMERVLLSIENRQGTDLTAQDLNRLRVSINDLQRQLASGQKRIGLLSPIINLNVEWRASFELLKASYLVVLSAHNMFDGLDPIINFLEQGENNATIATRFSSGERIVELLEIGQGSFQQATASLASAGAILEDVKLDSVSSDLILSWEQIKSYHQQLMSINSLLISGSNIFSQALGVEQGVTYLVLAQNNDEIRPSGGYISAYGWFTVRNGRVTDFDFRPTNATSPQPPPNSFTDTFEVPDWWLRFENPIYAAWDGSWYADFPSTAQLAFEYYNEGQNPNAPVDGIIAIDIQSLELIFEALGQVSIPDYEQDISAQSLRDMIYNPSIYGNQDHKRYIASIYRAIFAEWQGIDQASSVELLAGLLEALTQKHIMLYMPDQNMQEVIDLLGWSGAQLIPEANDYLLVADANLVNKANHSVFRSITYDVEIQPDQTRLSNLRVRYDYFDSVARDDPAIDEAYYGPNDYKTLTQIYLPDNVTILEEDNLRQSSVNDWGDYTLVVSRVDVDYDTSERIELIYETTPTDVRFDGFYRYRLLIQKQAGSQVQDVNVQIRLPQNANIITLSPEADASYNLEQPILDFQLQLVSDQWIEVIYSLN